MRRAIIAVVLAATLAVPASAAAIPTLYSGGGAVTNLVVKGEHKKKVSGFVTDSQLPLRCDEGPTSTDFVFGDAFQGGEGAKIRNGKFHVKVPLDVKFEVIADDQTPLPSTYGKFVATVRGKFKNNNRKARGTVSMSGDWYGPPAPNGYYDLHYHNCSGTFDWKVHK